MFTSDFHDAVASRVSTFNKSITVLFLALVAMFVAVPAMADDWVAEQLRGRVFVFSDGEWSQLKRGDVVSDERYIRTLDSGRVTFTRGEEVIEVSSRTQVRIVDSNNTRFTTVMQDFGQVTIEAEVEQVQHFAVVTPNLAAVVKGTRFSVTTDGVNCEVLVERGLVQVRDNQHQVMTQITPGQKAHVERGRKMTVDGPGEKAPMTTFDGDELTDEEVEQRAENAKANANANPNAMNKRNNGNGNGNAGNNGNGNGNAGNNGNGNGNGNAGNNGNGNNGNGNSGNNGNGKGNGACNSKGNGIKNCD